MKSQEANKSGVCNGLGVPVEVSRTEATTADEKSWLSMVVVESLVPVGSIVKLCGGCVWQKMIGIQTELLTRQVFPQYGRRQ
jgi:hypothetical protein